MNKGQISKKNMYNKVIVFFAANGSVWSSFSKLVALVTLFINKNKRLDDFIQQQQQTTTGITTGKDDKIKTMSKLVVKSARKARVWAEDKGNETLEALFDVRKEDFEKGSANVVVAKAKDVSKGLRTNVADLGEVNVTDADVDAIDEAIAKAETALGTPGAAKAEKEAGTEGIDEKMVEIDATLESIDDLLINQYDDTYPELVDEYHNVRKIDNIGTHATTLEAETLDAQGNRIENVQMEIVELNKKALSSIEGLAVIKRFKPGTYHVKCSKDGLTTQVMIVKIERGKVVHLKVTLV